jgi:hypothetical protein
MKRITVLLVLVACFASCPVDAEYSFARTGVWPKSWPKELEPLRKQSRTIEGPRFGPTVHEIPFTSRESFESAWPHLLTLKSKSAPLILQRGPHVRFKSIQWPALEAGVRIVTPSEPYPPGYAAQAKKEGVELRTLTDIELVIDGQIVDLNRIPLPADTPIIDRRFAP